MAVRNNRPLIIVISFLLVAILLLFLSYHSAVMEINSNKQSAADVQSKQVIYVQKSVKGDIPVIEEPMANRDLQPAGNAPPEQELERIWNYVYKKQNRCTESEYLGGRPLDRDGAYDLCIEERFWPIRNNPEHKCLMYSFGVGGDLTFDDEIARRGCEVHSFDPSEGTDAGYKTKAGVTFHKIGISNEDNDHGVNGWKMRTLKTLLKELGHTNRHLDYLKVDTDDPNGSGFEDVLMQELLDTGMYRCVRQFAMEIHMPGPLTNAKRLERCRLLYHQMTQLNNGGWRLYNTTDNLRAIRATTNPKYTQLDAKKQMVSGGAVILWETAFVNFDVKGPCIVT